ncbi:nuclear transport factor 2 family protein [Streptomyces gobiensis]|uniref:nuclear transport factor 2 family protein n=1 Tax=Streptomyces gobiensis TaxID=2875706 RepID=UPI001E589D43|nr:nuclear transport factor 2 family protein [Streptomyces gobiensis]UGY94643.1 nuclear transport factor 2 family protein [Streptomyces gobiensis]
MITENRLSHPAVRTFVSALNAGDRESFLAVLTDDASMSDDGAERDLHEWTDREIFSAEGHMEVESESDDGLSLVARFRNSTWGEMHTTWRFTVDGERISRFETGQA